MSSEPGAKADLKPLELEERKDVVRKGISEANVKNKQLTEISEDALDLISDLSEGYPHFIQQFSYSAFESDDNNTIEKEDVERGAFRENGALEQLGHKYFQEHFYDNVGSNDYRRVLEVMANYDDQWVSRAQMIKDLNGVLVETKVDNALKSLKAKNIIIPDNTSRGLYKFPTKSFATWIKVKALEKKSKV